MTKIFIDNNRYEFDDANRLGRGGFGVVYRGHDRRLNRPVAIKAIHPHLLADPDVAGRFEQEAQALAQLEKHPAIVTVYDVVVQDKRLYIVMAYVPGQTLKQYCETHAPLPLEQTVAILRPLAEALDFAHRRGLLHRDVKPGNVLLTDDLQPVLIDFGLARILEHSTRLTLSGEIFGSPTYMAPEQADPNRREDVGPAADRYALGIIAYELLTGRVPFPGSDHATLNAHTNLPVPPPRQFRPNLPPAVEQAILKMLAKPPADRYPTCATFVEALARATRPIPAAERPAQRGVPGWLWAGGFAALLLVACLMGLGLREVGDLLTGAAAVDTATPTPAPTVTPTATAVAVVVPPTATATPPPTATDEPPTPPPPTVISTATPAPPTATATVPPPNTATATPPPTHTPTSPPPTATATPRPPTFTPTPSLGLGSTRTRAADGMTLVYVPGGSFTMGSDDGADDEKPPHPVTLDAFWLDQTEVTNEQYNRCVAAGNCAAAEKYDGFTGDDYPVVGVSWHDANNYCQWAGGRLPTEAEWEYAARGPEGNIYPWGNDSPTCDLAQFSGCDGDTIPAGSLPEGASWVGALDLAGNVWEWVADWYDSGYYQNSPENNPTGPQNGSSNVVRGGAWSNNESLVRSANRGHYNPANRNYYNGFRCVVSPGK